MRVLFDQGTRVPLRRYLPHHSVTTVFEKGWSTLQNGELLLAAEQEAFEIFVQQTKTLNTSKTLRTTG
jgi:hypothetical protein